jgi:hypothetical protein
MTTTATRASARDLGQARKAYANRLEEATGFTIRWNYDKQEQAWAFYLIDPCGDVEGDPWYCWADLVYDTQDAIDEYEHEYHSIEPKYYEDQFSDADGGL